MAPTGAGKSFIAVSQAKKGTVILVSDNVQLKQYQRDYPDLNYLMGKDLFASEEEYDIATERLWQGDVTVANYHAWFMFQLYTRALFTRLKKEKGVGTSLLIADEFHRLRDMLIQMGSGSFTRRKYPNLPITPNPAILIEYFRQKSRELSNAVEEATDPEIRRDLKNEWYSVNKVVATLNEGTNHYVLEVVKNTKVTVTRYDPDPELVATMLRVPRIILMSATPRPSDIALFGHNVAVYNAKADIPATQRPVHFVHTPYQVSSKTTTRELKPYIDSVLLRHRGQNGVIHLTYGKQEEFRKSYPNFIYHTPDTKDDSLQMFKDQGGILVASGCAEGIDLPGDLCRFQIIPWMLKPNLGDLWVKSRLAKRDGQEWYDWQTLLTFAQMAGRSTRNPDDWSSVYTFDPAIKKLFLRYQTSMWPWFKDALHLFTKV